MELELHCRPRNLVTLEDLRAEVMGADVIYVGEYHSDPVHEQNEYAILCWIHTTGKTFNLVTEDFFSMNAYKEFEAMLAQFAFDEVIVVKSRNRPMADAICRSLPHPTVAIFGSAHVQGAYAVDRLVRIQHSEVRDVTVIQEHLDVPDGIYRVHTLAGTSHVLVGGLRAITSHPE